MKVFRFTSILIGIASAMLLCSCNKKAEVTGVYQNRITRLDYSQRTDTLELHADGSASFRDGDGEPSKGKFELVGGFVEARLAGVIDVLRFKPEGSSLVLVGTARRFEKVDQAPSQ